MMPVPDHVVCEHHEEEDSQSLSHAQARIHKLGTNSSVGVPLTNTHTHTKAGDKLLSNPALRSTSDFLMRDRQTAPKPDRSRLEGTIWAGPGKAGTAGPQRAKVSGGDIHIYCCLLVA